MESEKLKRWFQNEKRDLPWRVNPTPYAVWVSEVMLQQTQVATVINYFEKWMQKFPTISSLANAPLEDVIKAWEGLGYYSRARNLHNGAKMIVESFDAVFPSNPHEMQNIKGLGPYTINAICSFAFHQRLAPVDGNVLRVLSRYYHIEEDISLPKVQKKFRDLAQSILPTEESWIHSEALIELGAKVCKKKPLCFECPLRLTCKSYKNSSQALLPIKGKKIAYEKLFRDVLIVMCAGQVIIKKQEENKIMKDLYEFPFIDRLSFSKDIEQLTKDVKEYLGVSVTFKKFLKEENQSFTKFRVRLRPILFEAPLIESNFTLKSLHEASLLPFSSGPRRILEELLID